MSVPDAVPAGPDLAVAALADTVGDPVVDVGVFRRAVGRFTTGVTVVTTRAAGIDHAMTASAFTSVSLDPPLVLVCIEREARFHDAVTTAGVWSVNVLDGSARAVSAWLATRGRPLHDQLDRVPHRRGPLTGTAQLDQSLATLECRTSALHDGGDHTIVVGEVLGAQLIEEQRAALVYYRGRYGQLD